MATLALAACLGFLMLSLVLFWLSRLIHPQLFEDAVITAGFSLAAVGAAHLCHLGLFNGAALPLLLLAAR
jgi:hypothetical protein